MTLGDSSLPSVPELADDYGLTELQARFVLELVACGYNAAEAARRAGYSSSTAKNTGYKNLEKSHIQAAIAAVTQPLTEAAEIEAERVLEEFRRIAFSNILDVVSWDAEGRVTVVPSEEIPREVGAAIKKMEFRETVGEEGEVLNRRVKLELHGKTKAMEQLGKYLGLWTDPTELQVQVLQVFNQLSPEELARLEGMDDEELLELIEDRGIYRLPEAVR